MDDIFEEKEEKRGKRGPNKKEDKKEDFLKSIFKKEEKEEPWEACIWPLRAWDVLFSPVVAMTMSVTDRKLCKNLPLDLKLPCTKFDQDWATHVAVYSKHTHANRRTICFI